MAAFTNLLLVGNSVSQLLYTDLLYLVGGSGSSFVHSVLKFPSMAMMIRLTAAISMGGVAGGACWGGDSGIVDLGFGPVLVTAVLRQAATAGRGSSVIMGGRGIGLTTVATWEASGQVAADVVREGGRAIGTLVIGAAETCKNQPWRRKTIGKNLPFIQNFTFSKPYFWQNSQF